MALRRIVELGGVGVAVAVDDALARRIRSSALWGGAKDRPAPAPAATARTPAGESLRERVAGAPPLHWPVILRNPEANTISVTPNRRSDNRLLH